MKIAPKPMHTNRRQAFQFRCSGFIKRWIRCQRPSPAAIGDLHRWPHTSMKISALFAITVYSSVLFSYSARAQATISNFVVPVASTPTNLARQISGADHVAIRYQFVAHPPQITNFSLSISGDRMMKIVGAVSSGTQHHGTISFWGWEMLFYRGTNCLARVPFSDGFFLDLAGHGEYLDETGALKKLYREVLDKAHVDKKKYGQIYGTT
jgi:hypothetical protein